MLETYLPVPNVVWSDDAFVVEAADRPVDTEPARLARMAGRFAVAQHRGDTVMLARDRYGLKLYFAIDAARGVVAANYIADLITAGIPLDGIYGAPAGAVTAIDLRRRTIELHRYHHLPTAAGGDPSPRETLAAAGERLSRSLRAITTAYPSATVAVCLSGGLDSALVAALAREHVAELVAYTYAFDDGTGDFGPDAAGGQRLANWLGIRHRPVIADANGIFLALPRALRHGQDWRDFNVHCAIVNELLAEAIAADTTSANRPVFVLTGDLMNEVLGDYTPVTYRGMRHYALPDIGPDLMRVSLVRGLQCGDREVGVFSTRQLVALQPYAQICDDLLRLPSSLAKPTVIQSLAGDLLPPWVYGRPKARAQVGGPTVRNGILPLLVDSGRLGSQLEYDFCAAIGCATSPRLTRYVRAGLYRFPHQYPLEDV
jgi:asparagine synthetase B (glutamine-hydrolysing)